MCLYVFCLCLLSQPIVHASICFAVSGLGNQDDTRPLAEISHCTQQYSTLPIHLPVWSKRKENKPNDKEKSYPERIQMLLCQGTRRNCYLFRAETLSGCSKGCCFPQCPKLKAADTFTLVFPSTMLWNLSKNGCAQAVGQVSVPHSGKGAVRVARTRAAGGLQVFSSLSLRWLISAR